MAGSSAIRSATVKQDIDSIPLPKSWSKFARHALLNVIGLVRVVMLAGREHFIRNGDVAEARVHRLETEVALLREELRILGSRMACINPHQRPQYPPMMRMAILQLRAIRGWSKAETARRFFVSDATIRSWNSRADDDSLLTTNSPVNRFPEFVRHATQQIKLFCPSLGNVKIAETLARAGIHIGKTTVGRILKEKPLGSPRPSPSEDSNKSSRIVAKYPNHTWHADTTAVPISGGVWTNWLPNVAAGGYSTSPAAPTYRPPVAAAPTYRPPAAVANCKINGTLAYIGTNNYKKEKKALEEIETLYMAYDSYRRRHDAVDSLGTFLFRRFPVVGGVRLDRHVACQTPRASR